MRWSHPHTVPETGREATLARVIETIDRRAPETKSELADDLGLSEHYLSELLQELKSMTLTTDWPGNRVASDLGIVAKNFEIIGDRACYIADIAAKMETDGVGIVHDHVLDIFDGGLAINDHVVAVLFDADVDRMDRLYAEEDEVHRMLDELFELVTAYEPEMYGHLATMTRALERTIYYWVNIAELTARLHTGLTPEHIPE